MHYGTIIRNGRVVDGSGTPWYMADVAITGDSIAEIGKFKGCRADIEIDAAGKVVCPGFIDTHTHYDLVPFEFAGFVNRLVEDKLLQGVTTVITGCCGNSMAPIAEANKAAWLKRRTSRNIERHEDAHWNSFGEYLSELEKCPLGTNFASYVGHTTLRFNALGLSDAQPTEDDMASMKEMLRQALEEGAVGLSAGLIYAPAIFSNNDEIVELASVLAEFNAPFACHLRNETSGWLDAVRDVIEVAEKNCIPGQIHHVKVMHQKNSKNLISDFIALVEQARGRGVDITCDFYPYNACCMGLEALLLPAWVREGDERAMIERLRNASLHEKITEGIYAHRNYSTEEAMYEGCGKAMLVIAKNNEQHVGKTLLEIGRELNISPLDAGIKLMIDSDITAMAVDFAMSEEDMETLVQWPLVMIGSDSVPVKLGWSAHPRNSGTFPRIIREYVRDRGVLTLEAAIQKMTGFPATRFAFYDRGFLKKGFKADIAIYDEGFFCDKATYLEPLLSPQGMEYVLVNGKIAVEHGRVTGVAGGRVIRRGDVGNRDVEKKTKHKNEEV